MTFAGVLVGKVDISNPRNEKQTAASTIPNVRMIGWIIPTPITRPIITGTAVTPTPNMNDASISPIRRVEIDIGTRC